MPKALNEAGRYDRSAAGLEKWPNGQKTALLTFTGQFLAYSTENRKRRAAKGKAMTQEIGKSWDSNGNRMGRSTQCVEGGFGRKASNISVSFGSRLAPYSVPIAGSTSSYRKTLCAPFCSAIER